MMHKSASSKSFVGSSSEASEIIRVSNSSHMISDISKESLLNKSKNEESSFDSVQRVDVSNASATDASLANISMASVPK